MGSLPQHQGQRTSFTNRISAIFERRRAPTSDVESVRATTTFEVPLFLSPTRYRSSHTHNEYQFHEERRSRSSTQSLIDAAASVADRVRPLSLPSSSRYSSPAASPTLHEPAVICRHDSHPIDSIHTTNSTNTHRVAKDMHRHRRRRRRISIKSKMRGLKRLCAVFGTTLLLTLIAYLALAVTGTAVGVMFHVLMILLILSLTGVFAHTGLRLFFLSKAVDARRIERRRAEHWHGRERHQNVYFGEIHPEAIDHHDESPPEKAIRIIMADDNDTEVTLDQRTGQGPLAQPPPVYGNFRSSKRINPDLVHWQKVPPSPLTPTYDQAMSDVHRVVGYRPPSYIESESGATRIVEQGRYDVEQALRNIHPLERERMAALKHNMI